jgi:outer membrane protein assembly factor BamE
VNRISIPAETRRPGPGREPRRAFTSRTIATIVISLAAGGCSTSNGSGFPRLPSARNLPFIHKIDIQQGNVITQEMVARLRRGMDKKQVLFVMGSPIIKDTFNAHRWEYVYTFQPGGGRAEGRQVTLVFADEKLDHLEGNVTPATGELAAETHQDVSVEVPLYVKKNLLARLKDKMPFTGEHEEEYVYDAADLERDDDEASQGEGDDEEGEGGNKNDTRDTQVAAGPTVLVPKDAPTNKKKRGFFRRILDGVGLGAKDDEEPGEYDPGDPKYKDITNPDDL